MGDYLAHFGVKGMRWGIRRYQNPDGTLTEEGRQRVKNYYRNNRNDKAISKVFQKEADKLNPITKEYSEALKKDRELRMNYSRNRKQREKDADQHIKNMEQELKDLVQMEYEDRGYGEKWVEAFKDDLVDGEINTLFYSENSEGKKMRKQLNDLNESIIAGGQKIASDLLGGSAGEQDIYDLGWTIAGVAFYRAQMNDRR